MRAIINVSWVWMYLLGGCSSWVWIYSVRANDAISNIRLWKTYVEFAFGIFWR